jgi:hypothetical protein
LCFWWGGADSVVRQNIADIASNIHLHAEESSGDYRTTVQDVSTKFSGMEKEYDTLVGSHISHISHITRILSRHSTSLCVLNNDSFCFAMNE